MEKIFIKKLDKEIKIDSWKESNKILITVLSKYILEKIHKQLSEYDNIYEIEIGVDEGYGQGAWVKKNIKRWRVWIEKLSVYYQVD